MAATTNSEQIPTTKDETSAECTVQSAESGNERTVVSPASTLHSADPASRVPGTPHSDPASHPQSKSPPPPSPQGQLDSARKRLRGLRPPSALACRRYVHLLDNGLSTRAAGRQCGVGQPRMKRVIQRVEEWMAATGNSPTGHAPREQLHLALLAQKRQLTQLLADVERLMQTADQPYDALTKVVFVDGREQVQWKLIRQSRTALGYSNLRDRILARLRQVEEMICELSGGARAESGQSEAPAAPGHANAAPRSNSRIPPPPPILETVPLPPTPSAPLTPPNWLAYPRCPEPETYDESSAGGKNAKSIGKKTYATDFEPYAGATADYMACYWRYHALGLRQEIPDPQRRRFVDIMLSLDQLAEQAEAMAWAELASRPPQDPGAPERTYSTAECQALRCIYFDRLLDLDCGYSPQQRQSILERYDPRRGKLDWWQPGRISGDEEDLTWIDPLAGPAANDQSPEPDPVPRPAGRGPDVPLPVPAAFTREEREYLLNLPGRRRVAAARLNDCYFHGAGLKDVPIDQEQVVIYQAVEEVIKESAECRMQNAEFGKMSNDENQMTKAVPDPKSEIPNPDSPAASTLHSAFCTLQSKDPHAHIPSPLTPALRDEIYQRVGKQGVAVFGLDGKLYEGQRLSACGLQQRGVLFLRELAHSTPDWGESPWGKFKPKPRPK